MFNALQSLDAVDGSRVLDLFAGSGALGIEAASRGAAEVVLVDSSPRAVDAVRTNLAATGTEGVGSVVRADALDWTSRAEGPFDLVLLDPPYEFERWTDLLVALGPLVAGDGLVVIESDRDVEVPPGWRVVRDRVYGSTHVRIAACDGDPLLPLVDGGALP